METTAVPAVLIALALAMTVGALRCLADHLLASALFYAIAAAALAGVAGKLALEAI
jgi:hypothetical protein